MTRESRDLLAELDDLRVRTELAAYERRAYDASRASRIGNIVAFWAAAKDVLFKRDLAPPVFLRPRIEQENSPLHGPGPWMREAHAASASEILRLHGEIARLTQVSERSRDAARAASAERDAERGDVFGLRESVARLRENLAAAESGRAQMFADLKAEQRRARGLAAERDVALDTAAKLQARVSESQARPKPNLDARDAPLPAEIVEKRERLIRILGSAEPYLGSATPDVTVVIPAYDQAAMTMDCLQSVATNVEDGPTMQLVVVDDASPNEPVSAYLAGLPFVTILRNGANLGFLRSCNTASRLATGRYVHFLNNDTLVRPGWLSELVRCADDDETIGAVGSRLLFEDGSLQEAGGIIWRDASGWNYGRGDDPEDAKYNYVRDVDYLSGASLLVRTDLFRELGCFDDAYAPAYFEDSDLCFAIRAAGKRVVYQPKSTIVHLEGVSSGTSTDAGVKRHQIINKPKFANKWHAALQHHYVPESTTGIRAARRLQRAKTLVMIDNYVPEYDKDSGSNKLFNFIKLYAEIGYDVVYVPDNYHRSEPYTTTLQNLGFEVLYGSEKQRDLQAALRERLAFADVVWMGRPEVGDRYIPIVREFPNIPVLYDTHDLHYVRVQRELELKGVTDAERWTDWEHLRDLELKVVGAADIAMTVTDVERRVLENEGLDNVFVMPNVHDSYGRSTPYDQTEGVLFIGGYVHGPNVDAAVWLCEEIMPIVWRTHPTMTVTLIGSNVTKIVSDLASDRVTVAGFIPDVAPYFERARLMVAPLRYGAGLKGKIGHAFAYELPVVTTPIGAEGFDIESGRDALVEDDAQSLARAIVRAYDDRELWRTLSGGGAELVKRFGPAATRDRLAEATALAFARRAAALASERR